MAYHMERMLPELDDLEKRELFTRNEIKEIVRHRRDFEYLLKRHSALSRIFYDTWILRFSWSLFARPARRSAHTLAKRNVPFQPLNKATLLR